MRSNWTVQIEENVKRKFKGVCGTEGFKMHEGLKEALLDWCNKFNEKPEKIDDDDQDDF